MSVNRSSKGGFSIKTVTSCAVLVAVTVVLSRFLVLTPTESSRYSIEAVPIFLSGLLFGPVAGALVGFAADLIGCLFSPFGYNPIFVLPPILYGFCGGMFASYVKKNQSLWRIAIAFVLPVLLGSIVWQSFTLTLVYGGGGKSVYFVTTLISRAIQFGVMWVIDTLLVWMLLKAGIGKGRMK